MSISSVSANVDVANMALQRLGQPVIASLTDSSRDANIINQLYSQNRDYCLQLADWDCLRQRAVLTRSGKVAISGATAADPVVVTTATHTLITNELIHIEDVAGMTQLNDNTYRVFAYTSVTISLYDLDGTSTNGTAYTAWTSGGYVFRDGGDMAFVYDLPSDCMVVRKVLDEAFGASDHYTWRKERNFIYTDVENAGIQYTKQVTDPSLYEADLVEVIVARLAWFVSMRIHSDKSLRQSFYVEMQAAIARAKMTNARGSQDDGEPEQLWVNVR